MFTLFLIIYSFTPFCLKHSWTHLRVHGCKISRIDNDLWYFWVTWLLGCYQRLPNCSPKQPDYFAFQQQRVRSSFVHFRGGVFLRVKLHFFTIILLVTIFFFLLICTKYHPMRFNDSFNSRCRHWYSTHVIHKYSFALVFRYDL